jgi:hypothetical protein
MNRRVLLAGLVLLVLLSSCRSGENEPAPPPSPTSTRQPIPTSTPASQPTPTLSQVTVRLMKERVNCRFGPGTVYQLINEIPQGRALRALGRNDTSTWWYVRDPGNPDGFCWVSADVTEAQGDTDALPVVPPPVASITRVDLRVEPNLIFVSCSQFPQTVFFEAQVTSNGPTLFNWQWEISNGAVSDIGTLIFEEAGTLVINDYYQINAPNEYWVRLNVLVPNEMMRQVNFPVNCTP